jgi:hypothetical protein
MEKGLNVLGLHLVRKSKDNYEYLSSWEKTNPEKFEVIRSKEGAPCEVTIQGAIGVGKITLIKIGDKEMTPGVNSKNLNELEMELSREKVLNGVYKDVRLQEIKKNGKPHIVLVGHRVADY